MYDMDRQLTEHLQERAEADGFEVEVRVEDDESPDLSYLGTYRADLTKIKSDGAFFDRALDRVFLGMWEMNEFLYPAMEGDNTEAIERVERWNPRDYRFIDSCNYAKPGTGENAVSDDDRRKYIEQDARRLLDYTSGWHCLGIVVEVGKNGVVLAEAAVWGVESDSDDGYYEGTAVELYDQAKDEAERKLAELRKEKESIVVHRDVMTAVLNAITYADTMYSHSIHSIPPWLATLKEARADIVKKLDDVA